MILQILSRRISFRIICGVNMDRDFSTSMNRSSAATKRSSLQEIFGFFQKLQICRIARMLSGSAS
jgi:hypothetical protein